MRRLLGLIPALGLCAHFAAAAEAREPLLHGRGVNYETGNGMDQLNCDGGDPSRIDADMRVLRALDLQWVRIETAQTAISGLPNPPTCPALPEFAGLRAMLAGVASSGARPLIDILGNHYDPTMRAGYRAWLRRLLDEAPDARDFEIGNEENLSRSTEGYAGAPDGAFPYGWDFDANDFQPTDLVGECPTVAAKNADLERGVTSYVAWLADTYTEIKRRRPEARIVLGGLSSYQPACWTRRLLEHDALRYVDAIAYHPYGATPGDSVATLDTIRPILRGSRRRRPIWITEFGFATWRNVLGGVSSEQVKAAYLAQELDALAASVAGPILYYTARDAPRTTAQWQQQCLYVTCLPATGAADPAKIPGTNDDVSGYGLFEVIDGKLVVEPAAAALRGPGKSLE